MVRFRILRACNVFIPRSRQELLALQKPFDGSIPENNCGAQRDPTKWTAMDSPKKKERLKDRQDRFRQFII